MATRNPYRKVFASNRKLITMLELRRSGWDVVSLAFVFGVDPTSVYDQCKKYYIPRGDEPLHFSVGFILSQENIKVRKEKSYAEYLSEAKMRDREYANYISIF